MIKLSPMRWLYLVACIAFFIKLIWITNPTPLVGSSTIPTTPAAIVEAVVQDSGVPNAVSGIIFRNRLYDTIFEVTVFTIAIMGIQFLLANERPSQIIRQFTDQPSIVLARLGATIAALVSIELAIRGHLSPGGGFAAGVAGGTAIGLVAITSPPEWLQGIYRRWRVATWEKISVLIFIGLAAITLMGWELPHGELGALVSGGVLPLMNILVAFKVALGSWAAILLFIHYRGLL
ncbi:Na(+)/H(+) antiporter subunit B [Trichothermofontia sp.]